MASEEPGWFRQTHENPVLNSWMYKVEMSLDSIETLATNLIAKNLLSKINEEGETHTTMKEIFDHRSNDIVIRVEDGFTLSANGQRVPTIITAGWELEVEFKDQASILVPFETLKPSNPLEVVNYAIAARIDKQPVFNWKVYSTFKKRDHKTHM